MDMLHTEEPHAHRHRDFPLGAISTSQGVHFALYAPQTEAIRLVIQVEPKEAHAEQALDLSADHHKGDDGVWRIFVEGIGPKMLYGYLIDGQWVVDPYARLLTTPATWSGARRRVFGQIVEHAPFSWEGVSKPGHPIEALFIYEMHIRGFTADASSRVHDPGTFLGVVEKIPHLQELGINAVELLPVFSFDERPQSQTDLCNYWGYSPESFFSLMHPYGSRRDFQEMVKALHQVGIEVILDVVYNHVGCGWLDALSRSTYFITCGGAHTNFTGCGNTISTNHPVVRELILESLRTFATEMQVDGFRFDLASIFCRAEDGTPLEDPPIIRAMCEDPHLRSVKLIAEPWDCGGLYQVGSFPGTGRIAQWNDRFRDSVRKFIKGTDGSAGPFAAAMAGSAHFTTINFITAHDGFTLHDLVTYNDKHNVDNGEQGRDGCTCNESWNCGHEGPTQDPSISQLRIRQMKNLILALCFSQGTPMMLMGDEYGHSRGGNNNPYCQDNALNYYLWDVLKEDQTIFPFFKRCISLRKGSDILNRKGDLGDRDVEWHETNWDPTSRFVAFVIRDSDRDMLLAFNTSDALHLTHMPQSNSGRPWRRECDTSLESHDPMPVQDTYLLQPRSSVLLLS